MNPVAPVRGRITGKRPPDRDYVVVSGDGEEETEKRRGDGKK